MPLPGPLNAAGITVVDLTRQLAGPTATRILADLGARVIKVEQEGSTGDTVASQPQYRAQIWHSKERVSLDLRSADGLRHLHELLDKADVLVENFKPGVMKRMGLAWEAVHARHPSIIMASVSGFGQTGGPDGDRPAMDVVIQAMCGMMSITGFDDKPPAGAGIAIADLTSGMYAAIGILGALLGRGGKGGEGAYVDVAMLDSMAAIMSSVTVRQAAGVFKDKGYPRTTGSRSIAPFGIYPCQDGSHIAIIGVQPHYYASLCAVLGRPAMATEPRFANAALRAQHKLQFEEQLTQALSHKPMREWVVLLQAEGVPCGPVNDLAGAISEPQLAHRQMLVKSEDAEPITLIGNPIKISAYSDPPTRPPLDEAKVDIHTLLSKL